MSYIGRFSSLKEGQNATAVEGGAAMTRVSVNQWNCLSGQMLTALDTFLNHHVGTQESVSKR